MGELVGLGFGIWWWRRRRRRRRRVGEAVRGGCLWILRGLGSCVVWRSRNGRFGDESQMGYEACDGGFAWRSLGMLRFEI
jgi:hypothetical protein